MKRGPIMSYHFRPDGRPKRAFDLMADARLHAERTGQRFYRCEFCYCWHVGHSARDRKKRAA